MLSFLEENVCLSVLSWADITFLEDMPHLGAPFSLGVPQTPGSPLTNRPMEPRKVKTGKIVSKEDLTS